MQVCGKAKPDLLNAFSHHTDKLPEVLILEPFFFGDALGLHCQIHHSQGKLVHSPRVLAGIASLTFMW